MPTPEVDEIIAQWKGEKARFDDGLRESCSFDLSHIGILVAEIERLQIALRNREADLTLARLEHEINKTANASQKAEIERLRADKERLDWLDISWVKIEKFPNFVF